MWPRRETLTAHATARAVHLLLLQIRIWFQNRRQRARPRPEPDPALLPEDQQTNAVVMRLAAAAMPASNSWVGQAPCGPVVHGQCIAPASTNRAAAALSAPSAPLDTPLRRSFFSSPPPAPTRPQAREYRQPSRADCGSLASATAHGCLQMPTEIAMRQPQIVDVCGSMRPIAATTVMDAAAAAAAADADGDSFVTLTLAGAPPGQGELTGPGRGLLGAVRPCPLFVSNNSAAVSGGYGAGHMRLPTSPPPLSPPQHQLHQLHQAAMALPRMATGTVAPAMDALRAGAGAGAGEGGSYTGGCQLPPLYGPPRQAAAGPPVSNWDMTLALDDVIAMIGQSQTGELLAHGSGNRPASPPPPPSQPR